MQVLAGVIEVDDRSGLGEMLAGQVPDPRGAVAEEHQLADVAGAAAAGLAAHQEAELGGGGEGGQGGGGVRGPGRGAVLVEAGLGEGATKASPPGGGPAVFRPAGMGTV